MSKSDLFSIDWNELYESIYGEGSDSFDTDIKYSCILDRLLKTSIQGIRKVEDIDYLSDLGLEIDQQDDCPYTCINSVWIKGSNKLYQCIQWENIDHDIYSDETGGFRLHTEIIGEAHRKGFIPEYSNGVMKIDGDMFFKLGAHK